MLKFSSLIRNVSNNQKWMKPIGSVCTPLMVAAYKDDMEAVVMLLEAKPDVAIKSSYDFPRHVL